MKCPICERNVRDTDQECECGELLTTWANIRRHGHVLRQRGLARAQAKDHVGAVLSFLQAALTNPLDEDSLVDAARAMVHLDRTEEATAWLKVAAARPESRASASALLKAIENRGKAQTRRPLLGLGVLERSGHWTDVFRKKALDPVWHEVLLLEEKEEDFTVVVPWLRTLVGKVDGLGALRHALALGAWQRGQMAEAREGFEACLATDPPVLNPAAYYLAGQMDSEAATQAALERLRKDLSAGEIETVLRAVKAAPSPPGPLSHEGRGGDGASG